MSVFPWNCSRWTVALATFWITPGIALGQSSKASEEREEFQDAYKKQLTNQAALFSSAPNHHITPKRDNISFALDTKLVDLAVAPALDAMPENIADLDQRLEMTGWSVFPLVAFSADRFGVGFTGEAGQRQVKFLSREPESDLNAGSFHEQYSETTYTGAGIYGFVSLRSNALPKWIAGTLILGGRSLSAVQETQGTRTDSTSVPTSTRLKYDVRAFDVGINVAATLAKRFTVFPWFNYRQIQLGSIKDRNEKLANTLGDSVSVPVEMDRALIWQSEPDVTFGIDFAVQLGQFEAHLGGVFGYLATLNRGADRVQDKAIQFSLAYDLKSR